MGLFLITPRSILESSRLCYQFDQSQSDILLKVVPMVDAHVVGHGGGNSLFMFTVLLVYPSGYTTVIELYSKPSVTSIDHLSG